MGTSTAGIAHAAIAAHILGIPMGYVRSGAKDHGRNNRIEGRLEKGQKVVVIEDLISTGGSVIEVVEALQRSRRRSAGYSQHIHLRYEERPGKTQRCDRRKEYQSHATSTPICISWQSETGYIRQSDR